MFINWCFRKYVIKNKRDGKNRDKIKISGRGAVGSARGSGLRGRQFKSGRPDHSRRKNRENLFSLFERRRVERFCEAKAYHILIRGLAQW